MKVNIHIVGSTLCLHTGGCSGWWLDCGPCCIRLPELEPWLQAPWILTACNWNY